MKPHLILLLALLPLVGCGSGTDLSSKLVGEWQGRPELATERLLREWPTDDKPAEERAEKLATKTDLEAIEPMQINMKLSYNGDAELNLDGGKSRAGKWLFLPTNTTQGMLEIAIKKDDSGPTEVDESDASKSERRRFVIELLVEEDVDKDRFLLVEEGADLRYGRLLFERKSS